MNELKRDMIQIIVKSIKHMCNGFTIQDVQEALPEFNHCVIKKYLYRGSNNGVFIRVIPSKGGRGNFTKYVVLPPREDYPVNLSFT